MTLDNLAWVVRTAMVAAASLVAFLLVQQDVILDPTLKVFLGGVAVVLASLNPTTVAGKLGGTDG